MIEYFSKWWDGLDMVWTSLSYLERYYTLVFVIWALSLILRLIVRRRSDAPVPVLLVQAPADPAPDS